MPRTAVIVRGPRVPFQGVRTEALQKMGSKAETAVLGYVDNPDVAVRVEACKILGVIGTARSKAALDKASTDRNPRVADEARRAATAVAARAG